MTRAILRAHQLRSVGHGQRWLVEREWLADGRVMQRVNPGIPIKEDDWREVSRWSDLAVERTRLAAEAWEVDEGS